MKKFTKCLLFYPNLTNILIMSQNGKRKNFIHLLGDKLFIELSFDCFPLAEESDKNFIPTAKKINQCSASQPARHYIAKHLAAAEVTASEDSSYLTC